MLKKKIKSYQTENKDILVFELGTQILEVQATAKFAEQF